MHMFSRILIISEWNVLHLIDFIYLVWKWDREEEPRSLSRLRGNVYLPSQLLNDHLGDCEAETHPTLVDVLTT